MTTQKSVRRSTWTSLQPWRVVVLIVGSCGAFATVVAATSVATTGLTRPWLVVVGLLATVLINQLYVLVARRGEVLEAIDLAEGPIIALALVLPPAEALLTFVIGSAITEIPRDRARVKKVFNVGIRATGAGLLLLPLLAVGPSSPPGPAQYAAVAGGAVLYTVVNALAVSTIIASVTARPLRTILLDGTGPRVLVWSAALAAGLSSAYAVDAAPGALVGVIALLVVISATTATSRRAQQESERLRHVLDTSTRIQSGEDTAAQEAGLLEVARELLLWKDVTVSSVEPGEGEQGALIDGRDGHQRWLVASPRPDSDPWGPEDSRILEAIAGAARGAFDRTRLQAELARQARLDALTGVANRRSFDEVVDQLSVDPITDFGVILCDLDGFKRVNDDLGHDAGDELLRITAARIAGCVRSTDLVARLGGDEFVVVLPSAGATTVVPSIAAKIAASLNQPVEIDGHRLDRIAHSLGFATGPADGTTAREVVRGADAAMYAVKHRRATGRAEGTGGSRGTGPTVTLPSQPTRSDSSPSYR